MYSLVALGFVLIYKRPPPSTSPSAWCSSPSCPSGLHGAWPALRGFLLRDGAADGAWLRGGALVLNRWWPDGIPCSWPRSVLPSYVPRLAQPSCRRGASLDLRIPDFPNPVVADNLCLRFVSALDVRAAPWRVLIISLALSFRYANGSAACRGRRPGGAAFDRFRSTTSCLSVAGPACRAVAGMMWARPGVSCARDFCA